MDKAERIHLVYKGLAVPKCPHRCDCAKCDEPENYPNVELLEILVEARNFFGHPMEILEGYCCPKHTRLARGQKMDFHNYHLLGEAFDVRVKNVHPVDLYNYLSEQHSDRLGLGCIYEASSPFEGFVHIDMRSRRYRGSDVCYNTY